MTPDIRQGIIATAQSLGIDPVDLATAISYETGGTFDPTKAGPTTQWGQHRGLIQFGEPQAKQYGVDWSNPVASQLGPDGAVARYLRDTGVKPGMGMLDIYSAINAGGVGRYNASDANNGGAPGTVRDKVDQQMADHRAKAIALLGGTAPRDRQAPAQKPNVTRLAMAYRNGQMTPEDAALFEQGMADGTFPQVKRKEAQPDPLASYEAVAMRPRTPIALAPLQASATNAIMKRGL